MQRFTNAGELLLAVVNEITSRLERDFAELATKVRSRKGRSEATISEPEVLRVLLRRASRYVDYRTDAQASERRKRWEYVNTKLEAALRCLDDVNRTKTLKRFEQPRKEDVDVELLSEGEALNVAGHWLRNDPPIPEDPREGEALNVAGHWLRNDPPIPEDPLEREGVTRNPFFESLDSIRAELGALAASVNSAEEPAESKPIKLVIEALHEHRLTQRDGKASRELLSKMVDDVFLSTLLDRTEKRWRAMRAATVFAQRTKRGWALVRPDAFENLVKSHGGASIEEARALVQKSLEHAVRQRMKRGAAPRKPRRVAPRKPRRAAGSKNKG